MSIDKKSSYYDAGGIETFEVIKAKLSPEQLKGYLLGNIIKYACRANYKDCYARDIEKIKVYSELLNNESFVSKTFEPSVNHGIDFTWLTNLSSGKTFEPSDTIR